ncbi:MAG: glutaminyl-peptide cyclotransferase [Verrucomicrobiota bacterium]|jgi:Zn-dependent M28 family amino/carboxypeptidase
MATMICNACSALSDCLRTKPSRLAAGLWIAFAFLAACDRANSPSTNANGVKIWEQFSGEKALAHVQTMVDFGPRPPASEAIEKTRTYLTKQLESFGWKVERQTFADETPRGKVQFVNLIATFAAKERAPSFLVCSHYDTKTFDNARFVGANDGGSSTGVLLELARVLAQRPDLARKAELVFFDGEEAYEAFTETDGLFGSRYFAKQLAAADKEKQFRGGILFDMVGDRSLTITLPPDSPVDLARGIFASSEALGLRKHFTYFDRDITDDHTPLNEIGIPTIDLIDFDFPAWHTPADTMDKLSAESLRITGAVACHYLSEVALK